ncbi:hypothetical protein AB834_07250 [PVC group bacterium (ex Bugula neritina AB1)]|nr:hypothetical protein AB834_07250 [PVC group bacterium (ex Bugula neritina AB1)]
MIDTHCHVNFEAYDEDRDEVLKRAIEVGVKTILIPGTTIETSVSAISMAESFDFIYAAAGVHPTEVNDVSEDVYQQLSDHLDHPKVKALGEIGMDLFHDPTLNKKQRECMERFADLSIQKDKPLIIHNRDSEKEMRDFLSSCSLRETPGVFHCFAGDVDFAKCVLDYGFYISFTGIVTFKNAKTLQEVAKYVPLDRILLETDSPYLTPHPYRGKRNEPCHVKLVAEKIASLKDESFERICEVTTANACGLFDF